MRKQQASITALGIAMLRAFESARPPDERVCFDPYARRFIPGWFYWFSWLFMVTGYAEMRGPGLVGFLAARDRYIDDLLQSALEEGAASGAPVEQVVILGAGYDSRAYRFDALKTGVRVFEVDHPASQAGKLKRLEKVFGQVPAHVVYVDVDFNQQTLKDRLLAKGYDPSLKTFFIWQGVVCYLTAEAVDETLSFIAHCSGSGSVVAFDYIDQSVLEGRARHGEVTNMRRYRGLTGEGLVFGIPEGTIAPFLEARGFCQVKDARPEDLHAMYFTGKRASRKVSPGYGIVSAAVA